MNRRSVGAALFLLLIAATFVATFAGPAETLLTVEGLQRACADLNAAAQGRWPLWAALFFVTCVVATSLSFPVGPVIGIASGALFGFWTGLLVAWGAAAVGSTISFLGSRHLFRDWVEGKLGDRFRRIESAFEEQGAIYLLTLRFNPFVPYWLVNLSMGLTHMRLPIYVPLTLIGLLPAFVIYAHAGTELATLHSIGSIMSPPVIAALLVLSFFPILVKLYQYRHAARARN
ncbi:MAG: TVP38/TMEM64 family protein [Allosphingosinicella sp.]|uniref:TVP38/TMEM64 family protein n=1 Tax=Allosphingosinicella sp. TaxID=2823234 RepID=UPI00392C4FE9